MTNRRYGKESGHLIKHKSTFFDDNQLHIEKQKTLADIYTSQPHRIVCKNCESPLSDTIDFVKAGIGYTICDNCTHLNGVHQDTDEFCAAVYTENSGETYGKTYKTEDIESYNDRVAAIYTPKAEFLVDSLSEHGLNPHEMSFMDFGAGSGYLTAALSKLGLENVSGTDVAQSQVNFGNAMIGKELLQTHRMEETKEILEHLEANVVCMIGVLEHVQHPRETLSALNHNKNVQFLYVAVPMFSFSVFLEILSPDVFHRHLHGGHTHLYTPQSLQHLQHEFGFESIAEWWFGTDMVDLYRHIAVAISGDGYSERLRNYWQQHFAPLIDNLQLELDKEFFASQIHVLLRKKN